MSKELAQTEEKKEVGKRPPNHVYDKNVARVFDFLRAGLIGHQIHAKFPDYSPKTVNNWIQAANNLQREYFAKSMALTLESMLSKLWYVYSKAVEEKDYRTSLQALKQIAELTGADSPKQIDVRVLPEAPTQITLKVDQDVK